MRHRVSRRIVAAGRRLPPGARRQFRRVADELVTRLTSPAPARGPAQTVTCFDYWAHLAELSDDAVAALTGAGIEVVRLERDGRTVLAVPAEARAAALAALAGHPATAACWLAAGRRRPVQTGSGATVPDGDDLSLFRSIAAPDGTVLTGSADGLKLQFWRAAGARTPRPDGGVHPVGTRLAPTRNHTAPYLTPQLWRQVQSDDQRRLLPAATPHLLSLSEPVDIVYTWVDDSDPEWRRRRSSVSPVGELSTDALHTGRTRSRDELRYSLRSVASHAGWFRHIWLVTDGQRPPWLADHPRLTVVSHRDIFSDPGVLPTFNSHAIESQLHHIDGLSEHFVYLNDDVFIGRPIRPETFFTSNGLAKFTVAPIAIDRQLEPARLNGAMLAARNNRELLAAEFGRSITNRIQHIPHAHRRSSLAELERRHPEAIARVAASRFRSAADLSVASELGHYWAYATGAAVTTRLAFQYVDIGSAVAAEQLDSLLARRNKDCFCINDAGPYPEPVDAGRITDFLSAYYPVPSPFEHGTAG